MVETDVSAIARLVADAEEASRCPLLVLRLCELERIAWTRGRKVAMQVEQRCWRRFRRRAAALLRPTDLLAHEPRSRDFLVVLIEPARSGEPLPAASCRTTLLRLASAIAPAAAGDVATGWMVPNGEPAHDLAHAVECALARGEQERERHAFFASVGHELRTPLTSIRGYIETLLEVTHDEETRLRFLKVAHSEVLRMARLLDGMSEISMLDVSRPFERLSVTDLGATLSDAVAIVIPLAVARQCCVNLVEGVCCSVLMERDRLLQVAVNILENAIKHGRGGGVIGVRWAKLDDEVVEVCFEDDGPGIPAAERALVFELGRRGRNVREAGSGLGLSIVRRIVEGSGGEADIVESVTGGACVRVRLRLKST